MSSTASSGGASNFKRKIASTCILLLSATGWAIGLTLLVCAYSPHSERLAEHCFVWLLDYIN